MQLPCGQQVAEVRCIPGDQNVVSSNGLSCDKDISVTFPSARLRFELPCDGQRLFVKVENVKSTQQGLRLLPCSLRSGKLRGFCFQERISSASELFYRDNDWKRDVLARNFGEICQEEWVIIKIVAQDVGVPEKNYAPPTR